MLPDPAPALPVQDIAAPAAFDLIVQGFADKRKTAPTGWDFVDTSGIGHPDWEAAQTGLDFAGSIAQAALASGLGGT